MRIRWGDDWRLEDGKLRYMIVINVLQIRAGKKPLPRDALDSGF